MGRTLAERVEGRDAERFVGRDRELRRFATLFTENPAASVVHVHGPGGIGKSTLLRRIARLGAERGWAPLQVDGRELAPVPGELEAIAAAAHAEERPLLLFDTYERMAALDGALRERVLPTLPARTIVVLAGREQPGREWFEGGWEHVVWTMALEPLSIAESQTLVRTSGIDDEATVSALVRWSKGSPLALGMASGVAQQEGRWSEPHLEEHPELVATLVHRMALAEPAPGHHDDVTAVAAIAKVTTASMLADVLPGVAANPAYRWLRSQVTAEPVADGVALHELVRRATRAELQRHRPGRERDLRRRIADHVFALAAGGRPGLLVDLAELIDDEALRWGFGADAEPDLRPDDLRPGELDDPPEHVRARAGDAWWSATRRLADAAPQHFVAARDRHDVLCGLAITCTPAGASDAALADPYLGSWLRHAAAHHPDGDVLVWRDVLDLTAPERGDLGSRVVSVVNTAAILRSERPNPRYLYVPISPLNTASLAFARRSGAQRIDGLDLDVGSVVQECHVIDHGPDGLLGAQRDAVYRELGLVPPAAAEGRAQGVTGEAVRRALRDLDRPSSLAASPLAAVVGGTDPAGAVRAMLERAVADAFGAGPEEALMREVAERAFLDHRTTHEAAAHALHLSRATYFRRLRQATDRVCDYVSAAATVHSRAAG